MQKLLKRYHNALETADLHPDKGQEKAVQILQNLLSDLKAVKPFRFWHKKPEIKGVYLYGGVGRGKSMLMDLFFAELPKEIKSRRIHFHEFMIETHDWLHSRRGKDMDNLLPAYAQHVADQVKVLCFDEFHITDVADAMILGRLFTHLFEHGVVFVTTSNWSPDKLYDGGLQRDLFLPFIQLVQDQMEVVHLDSETDYREIGEDSTQQIYFFPFNRAMDKGFQDFFIQMSCGVRSKKEKIVVKGRNIHVPKSANGVAMFNFKDLCEKPLAAEDYLALAQKYHTLFLRRVPIMQQDKRNELKRFILLIDCFYEAGALVVINAQSSILDMYVGRDHQFEFKRTISRLNEMQSRDYQATHEQKRSSWE